MTHPFYGNLKTAHALANALFEQETGSKDLKSEEVNSHYSQTVDVAGEVAHQENMPEDRYAEKFARARGEVYDSIQRSDPNLEDSFNEYATEEILYLERCKSKLSAAGSLLGYAPHEVDVFMRASRRSMIQQCSPDYALTIMKEIRMKVPALWDD